MIALYVLLSCRGGVETREVIEHTHAALVDDFRVQGPEGQDLGRSRMDTTRAFVGDVNLDGDVPILNDGAEPGGLRYLLPVSPAQLGTGITLDQLLGPTIESAIQPDLVGISVRLTGSGDLTAHLDAADGSIVWAETKPIRRRTTEVLFNVDTEPSNRVSVLGIDLASGFAELREIKLLFQERRPYADVLEEAYVFSHAQLSRCWDADVGLARVRCTPDEADAVYGPDVTGLYALASAVGADLGIVPEDEALQIVTAARDALLALPRDPTAGLLPERTDGTGLIAGSIWGSLSTVVALDAAILAAQHFELRTTDLQVLLETIDWAELTAPNDSRPILAGYDDRGVALDFRYGVFGSKSALVQIAHHGATGEFAAMEFDGEEPTWEGSGWDNELASLLFPMEGTDWVGNDWFAWRSSAHWQHQTYSRDTPAGDLGLFGFSLVEVPEPWRLEDFQEPVGVFGVGGRNELVADGSTEAGYPFFAPHYPATTSVVFPDTAIPMFTTLKDNGLLTPFNAVESVGVDAEGAIRHNHRLKGFTLAMQTLGLARAYSSERYLPYRLLDTLPLLREGHENVLPEGSK